MSRRNNADTAYRIVPLDGEARFEVYGQLAEHPPADVTFTLIANTAMSKTIATLEWRDVAVGVGVFRLTIGPEPTEGRRNHLQSRSDLRYLFVRDCLTDWARQRADRLADDEALVVTVTIGSAPYMSLMAHDPWRRTLDFAPRTASLNLDQLARDDDGSVTFVLSPADPGVHNRIDTGGVHERIFYFRWQGLPPHDPEPPAIKAYRVVRLSDLSAVLARSTRWVAAAERAKQQAAQLWPWPAGGSTTEPGLSGSLAAPVAGEDAFLPAHPSCDLARPRLRVGLTRPRVFDWRSGAEDEGDPDRRIRRPGGPAGRRNPDASARGGRDPDPGRGDRGQSG